MWSIHCRASYWILQNEQWGDINIDVSENSNENYREMSMLMPNNSFSMSIHSLLDDSAPEILLMKSMSMDLCMQGFKDQSRGLDKRIYSYTGEDDGNGIGGVGSMVDNVGSNMGGNMGGNMGDMGMEARIPSDTVAAVVPPRPQSPIRILTMQILMKPIRPFDSQPSGPMSNFKRCQI